MNLFLYKSKEDGKLVFIEDNGVKFKRFGDNNYFSKIEQKGSSWWSERFLQYNEIETSLTKEQYEKILDINNRLNKLGYCITQGDERYKKGLDLIKEAEQIYASLKSKKAQKLFEKIKEEVIEKVKSKYHFSKEEMKEILETIYLPSSDIVCFDTDFIWQVWNNINNFAKDIDEAYEIITDERYKKYFDYEKFGKGLLDERDGYYKLKSGRIIEMLTRL